jgi:hypothetical protein
MANDPISGLPALSAAPATDDLLVVVDVSDTTEAASGTTKNMTPGDLFTSPTFTGTPVVDGALTITGGQGEAEAGTITIQDATGLNLVGTAGTTHSVSILNEGLQPIMRTPVGTQDAKFGGIVSVPGVSVPVDTNVLGIGATTLSSGVTTGPGQALPATPAGYFVWYLGATRIAIPYYVTT